MVQILSELPGSFGQQFARQFGQGLSAGVGQASQLAQQMALKKYETKQRQNLISQIEGGGQQAVSPKLTDDQFISALPEIEQALGRELTPQDLDQLYSKFQKLSPQKDENQFNDHERKAKAYAAAGEHDLSRFETEMAKSERKEAFSREKEAEPKILEIEDKLKSQEATGMRFDRLNELFSPDLENKFPSSLAVGLLTKDGELRPTAMALLSPEAQEAVKLVSDELSGAKDTFGARVTNFDLQSYMKRLPTLLNSPEGRRRVLRDLRIMNKINQMHSQGILDIVDRYGGAGKISVSKAERIFRKEFAPQMKQLREEFVNPEKAQFSQMPDASFYPGRTLEDPDSGEKFVSNGKEWVPQ